MAKINVTISSRVYGKRISCIVASAAHSLGLPDRIALRLGLAMLFMRTECGGKASWHWLGRT